MADGRGRPAGSRLGKCRVCGEDAPGRVYCEDHRDPSQRPPEAEWVGDFLAREEEEPPEPDPFDDPPPPAAEVAPRPPARKTLRERVKDRFSSTAAQKPPKPRPRATKRVSLADDIGGVYGALGDRLQSTVHYPAGRMMAAQAIGAGQILDEAIAGTIVDRAVLQPMVKGKERWQAVSAVTLGPMLMIVMQNLRLRIDAAVAAGDEETAARLDGQFRYLGELVGLTIRPQLVNMLPAMQAAAERRAEQDKAIREAFPGIPEGVDPVQAFMAMLFAPPGGYPEAHTNGHAPTDVAGAPSPARSGAPATNYGDEP